MTIFHYVIQNPKTNKQEKGQIEAEHINIAKQKLKLQGLYLIQIKESTAGSGATKKVSLWQQLNRVKPSPSDVALATKQFGVLVRSAVNISDALKAVSEQTQNKELKDVYEQMRKTVSSGKSLAEAHREFPGIFDDIYVSMIGTAEKSGTLGLVLSRLTTFMFASIALKRKLVAAFSYPIIMLVVALGVTLFLFVSILPKMAKTLMTMKVEFPWYTTLIMNMSSFISSYWILILIVIISIVFSIVAWTRTKKGRFLFDQYLTTMPIIGPLQKRVAIARFSRTLGTILSSGIKIIEGLNLAKKVLGNKYIEKAIDEASLMVQDGMKLSVALEKTKVFTPLVINMVRTGEKTGKLDEMLDNVADAYDEEVDGQIDITTRTIQPTMILFIAGVVIVVVVAVMGPMLTAMQNIK